MPAISPRRRSTSPIDKCGFASADIGARISEQGVADAEASLRGFAGKILDTDFDLAGLELTQARRELAYLRQARGSSAYSL